LRTGQADRLVLMHGLETSEHAGALLEECWRSLGPGGRAVFVVPNRAGLWSRSDATPFGYGRPYSLGQLEAQLRRHRFVTERAISALYRPPSLRRGWRRSAAFLERAGRHMPILNAGGVLMIEASKQVTAPSRPGLTSAVKRPLRVLEGIGAPVPEPSRRR
jgi:SAM-dependent methyltransferase